MIKQIPAVVPVHPSCVMLRSEFPTYAHVDRWRAYQGFFPEHLRITEGREPTEEFWSWRGGRIHLDRFETDDAPATVVLLHGGGGCGRLLAPLGRMFHLAGYNAVLPDLPGYGLSRVPVELEDYDRWLDCAVDLVNAESARTNKPVFTFGMSIGGYLGLMTAMRTSAVKGVIATTLADPRQAIVRDQFAYSPLVNRLLTPFLSTIARWFGGFRLPIRWFANMRGIANDVELSRLLSSDPIAGNNRVTLRFFNSLLQMKPPVEPEDFRGCPVLFTQPDADRWTTLEASRPVFDNLACEKQLVLLENCGHLPVELPGVAELERQAIEFVKRLVVGSLAG
jgi:alpha-beta hydrolase superfamily lysophospholipase